MADPLSAAAVTAGAEALGHMLSNLKGKWIRRAAALTTIVETLRKTPRSGTSHVLSLKLADALAATKALGESGDANEDAKNKLKAAVEDAIEATNDAQSASEVTSKAVVAAQNAANQGALTTVETYLKIALSAAAEDPALTAAEAALIRHLEKLHTGDKEPNE